MINAAQVCLLCMKETPRPHQVPCPFCGGDDRTLPLQPPALPPRTLLDQRYLVGKTLGQGGFGITYQAFDLETGSTVAIKEYYPATLAGRESMGSTQLTVNAIKGERAKEEYQSGLRHFLYEARRQAKLASLPGIVSVKDFFEANGTAYYVMEYVDGCTLVKYIRQPLDFAAALALLAPVADSLQRVHEAGLIHRDISPDNIMCAKDGQLKLLDFGASHSFTEEESTTGNAALKHGFAPPEQYGSSSMQGPWTDVYAFAATLYWCVTGKIPQDSMDRSIGGDRLQLPSELGAVITPDGEAVLMRGLALPVTARYQDMARFWAKLNKAEHKQPKGEKSPFTAPGGATVQVPQEDDGEEVRVFRTHSQTMNKPEEMDSPEPTIQPSNLKDLAVVTKKSAAVKEAEPDLSRFRLSGMEDPEKRSQKEPEPTEQKEEPPANPLLSLWRRSPTTLGLVAVIALLAVLSGYLALSRPVQPQADSSTVVEEGVLIGGTAYAPDTTELHLTTDHSYVSEQREGENFTTVSYLTDADWASVCSLKNLKKLSLVGFDLASLKGLEGLTELEVLDVSHNDVTDLSPLNGLYINELYAADNQITQCPSYDTLVYLDLSDNAITDLTPLSSARKLSALSLRNNRISELTALSALTSLRTLDLSGNGLVNISALNELRNLKTLCVEGNTLTNAQLIGFLTRVPECTLDVEVLTDIPEEVEIGGRFYSTTATALDLESRSLKDEEIQNLKYMINLRQLKMAGNNVSDLSVLSRLYSLTYLDIGHNRCRDLSSLSGLTNLETLIVSSNQITDLSPVEHLTHLVNISAGNNPISDLSPLSELDSLRMIAICDFRAASLEPLYPLTGLIELRITRNAYSDAELEALAQALPRCTVNQFPAGK